MTVATLFGKLREYELELERLRMKKKLTRRRRD